MTLLETDRLIRKLREALRSPDTVASATAAGPAQAYADACAAAQRRLEQCGVLLDLGDEQQALQLAESPPPLLDAIKQLSFAESAQWREFCQRHVLPVAGAFDQRIVGRINTLYTRGITVQHPLYRDYRAHVMKHRAEEAVLTLRSIVRLNPSDTNAHSELARLEEKQQATQLKRLAGLLTTADDEPAIIALVNSIEDNAQTAGLSPEGAVWQQGLTVRYDQYKRETAAECRALLPQLTILRAAGKWQAANAVLAHAQQLQSGVDLDLDADTRQRFEEVRAWAARNEQEQTKRDAFSKAAAELEFAIEQSERRQAVSGSAALPALQSELAALHTRWRAVEGFEQSLPDNLEPRYRKRANVVRLEIERAQKRRTLVLGGGCALAAILCAGGIYFFIQNQKSSEMAVQLDRLIAGRQVEASAKLLDETRTREPARLDSASAKAATARTQVFIESERERQRVLAARLTALEKLAAETPKPFGSQNLANTGASIDEAQKATAALAPDYRPAAEARLAAIRNHWEAFLSGENTTRTGQFADALTAVEKRADEQLNYRSAEDLRRSLADLAAAMAPLAAMSKDTAVPQLKIRDDLAARYDALSARLATYGKDLELYDSARAGLGRAATLEDYLQALRKGQNSELGRSGRDLAPAKRLLLLPLTTDAILAAALMPDNPEGWTFFKANPTAGLVPTSAVLEPEQHIYDQLLVDSNIRNVYVYQAEAPPSAAGNRKGLVYARGKLGFETGGIVSDGWAVNPHGTFYDTMLTTAGLAFTDGVLNGRVKGETIAPDTQAFQDLHFRDLIDSGADRFSAGRAGAPMHEFLDRLTHSRASSLFKAYVFDQVCQMMQTGQRSGFFGWQYSPALRAHSREAQQIGIPHSGDWMVPDEIKRKGPAFEALFAKAAKISYADQARLLQASTREAAAGGVTFKGYVDAAGAPQLADPPDASKVAAASPPPDLWGWESAAGQSARLFAWSTPNKAYKSIPNTNALPLTPLLALEGNSHDLLRAAGRKLSISDDEIKAQAPYLPPYFQN